MRSNYISVWQVERLHQILGINHNSFDYVQSLIVEEIKNHPRVDDEGNKLISAGTRHHGWKHGIAEKVAESQTRGLLMNDYFVQVLLDKLSADSTKPAMNSTAGGSKEDKTKSDVSIPKKKRLMTDQQQSNPAIMIAATGKDLDEVEEPDEEERPEYDSTQQAQEVEEGEIDDEEGMGEEQEKAWSPPPC